MVSGQGQDFLNIWHAPNPKQLVLNHNPYSPSKPKAPIWSLVMLEFFSLSAILKSERAIWALCSSLSLSLSLSHSLFSSLFQVFVQEFVWFVCCCSLSLSLILSVYFGILYVPFPALSLSLPCSLPLSCSLCFYYCVVLILEFLALTIVLSLYHSLWLAHHLTLSCAHCAPCQTPVQPSALSVIPSVPPFSVPSTAYQIFTSPFPLLCPQSMCP